MNYKAELRGFSLDRAIKNIEVNPEAEKDIFKAADAIADYLYIAEKDIDSHLQTLFPLLRASGDAVKIDAFILTLEQMKAELEAGVGIEH